MPAAAWSSSFVSLAAESGLGRPFLHVTYIRGSSPEERRWMGAIFVLLGNLIPREGSMLVLLLRLVTHLLELSLSLSDDSLCSMASIRTAI